MDVSGTRDTNRYAVLRALALAGPMPRGHLAALVGLSNATVSRVVDDLIALGLAGEGSSVVTSRRGRNPTLVEFRGEGRVICGIDLGATNTRMLVSDLGGQLVAVERLPTPADLDAAGLARWLGDCADRAAPPGGPGLRATVVGIPGAVHPQTAEIRHADNLPAIDGSRDFLDELRSALPGQVSLANDANLAMVGEGTFGAAREARSAVMFTIGTGLGTGVLLDGRPLVGRTGLVGEFAYLPIQRPDGTALPLEDIIGGPALLRRAAELGHPLGSPGELFDPSVDAGLRVLRTEALAALLAVFSAVTLAYEPEVIILGGGVAPSLGRWLPDLQSSLCDGVPEAPLLVPSELGDYAGALGALARAWQVAVSELGLSPEGLDRASIAQLGSIPELLRIKEPAGSE